MIKYWALGALTLWPEIQTLLRDEFLLGCIAVEWSLIFTDFCSGLASALSQGNRTRNGRFSTGVAGDRNGDGDGDGGREEKRTAIMHVRLNR